MRATTTTAGKAMSSIRFDRKVKETAQKPTIPPVSTMVRSTEGQNPDVLRYRMYNGPRKAAATYDPRVTNSISSVFGCSNR